MFCRMVIGSIMTIVLLGGPTAADQILGNAKVMIQQQYSHPDTTTSVFFLILLGLSLASIAASRTKHPNKPSSMVNKLRRYWS